MENDDEELFSPDDIQELEQSYREILSHERLSSQYDGDLNGYGLEFVVSLETAQDLIRVWLRACLGDTESMNLCFKQYSLIMKQLHQMMREDGN